MAKPHKVYIVKRRLANGEVREYHYAWKFGPRIDGAPGTPTYLRSFAQLLDNKSPVRKGEFLSLMVAFEKSGDFAKLSDHTKRSYRRHLGELKDRFADVPIKALDDKSIRADFIEYRDEFVRTPRTADMAMGVLKRLLSWCQSAGYIDTNQAEPIGRLHSASKSEDIWTGEDIAAFCELAGKELRWAVMLGIHTGLRQEDLITLKWFEVHQDAIVRRTSKRDKTAIIPITPECRALLDSIDKRAGEVLTTSKGKKAAWTSDGLRASFNKVRVRAGVKRTFHDLRRTAATTLLAAGIDSARVALIMGWSENDVEQLKRIYVSRSEIVISVLASLKQTRYENASATETEKRTEKRSSES